MAGPAGDVRRLIETGGLVAAAERAVTHLPDRVRVAVIGTTVDDPMIIAANALAPTVAVIAGPSPSSSSSTRCPIRRRTRR